MTAPQKASAGDMSGHVPSKASLSYCQASLRRHCPDQVIRVTGKNRFLSVRSPSNIFNNHTVMQRSPSVKKISGQAQRGAGKGEGTFAGPARAPLPGPFPAIPDRAPVFCNNAQISRASPCLFDHIDVKSIRNCGFGLLIRTVKCYNDTELNQL